MKPFISIQLLIFALSTFFMTLVGNVVNAQTSKEKVKAIFKQKDSKDSLLKLNREYRITCKKYTKDQKSGKIISSENIFNMLITIKTKAENEVDAKIYYGVNNSTVFNFIRIDKNTLKCTHKENAIILRRSKFGGNDSVGILENANSYYQYILSPQSYVDYNEPVLQLNEMYKIVCTLIVTDQQTGKYKRSKRVFYLPIIIKSKIYNGVNTKQFYGISSYAKFKFHKMDKDTVELKYLGKSIVLKRKKKHVFIGKLKLNSNTYENYQFYHYPKFMPNAKNAHFSVNKSENKHTVEKTGDDDISLK
ncbi:MAG: hypothetical protein COA79_20925 [Planctomycetota bacterium]|nr:MAG: hypothetical protein COA79_20925 [Planctomycetota bacterium]